MNEPTERPAEPDAAAAAEMDEVRRRMRTYGDQRQRKERSGAAKWLLLLALIQLVLGFGLASGRNKQAAEALQAVAEMRVDELVTLRNGEQLTVGEYRASVETKVWRPLAVSIGLGVVFAVCFLWARRSPVPALLAALAVYIVTNVVLFVLDRSTLSAGILEKIVCFAVLVYAIRSTLQQSRPGATAPAA